MDEIKYFFEDHWKKVAVGLLGIGVLVFLVVLFTSGDEPTDEDSGVVLEDDDISREGDSTSETDDSGESEEDNESEEQVESEPEESEPEEEREESIDDYVEDSTPTGEDSADDSAEDTSGSNLEVDEEFLSSLEGEDLDEIQMDSEYNFSDESEEIVNRYLTEENRNKLQDFAEDLNTNVEGVNSVEDGFVVLEQYLDNPLRCGMDNYNYYMCIVSTTEYVVSTHDSDDIDYDVFNDYLQTGKEQIVRIEGVLNTISENAEEDYSGNDLNNIGSVVTYYNTLNTILFLNGELTEEYISGDSDLSGEDYQSEIEILMTDYSELMGNDEHLVNSIKDEITN